MFKKAMYFDKASESERRRERKRDQREVNLLQKEFII